MTQTEWCRQHAEIVARECGRPEGWLKTQKKASEFTKDHTGFAQCSTSVILKILSIKNRSVKSEVIAEAESQLLKRNEKGYFKQDYSEPEIDKLIRKYEKQHGITHEKSKKKLPLFRFTPTLYQIEILNRVIKKGYASSEKDALRIVIEWAMYQLNSGER